MNIRSIRDTPIEKSRKYRSVKNYVKSKTNRFGAVSNMIDPRTSTEGIAHYIEEVNSKLVIAIDVAMPKIEKAVVGTKAERIISVSPFNSLPTLKRVIVNTLGSLKVNMPKLPENCMSWNDFIKLSVTPDYAEYKKDTCCVIVHTAMSFS